MLTTEPSFERRAINRVTFGARDSDVAYAESVGWNAWVNEQLNPPPGDDPALAQYLTVQTIPIKYQGKGSVNGGWQAVDEVRPLNYLNASTEDLLKVVIGVNQQTVAPQEEFRIQQEVAAASWIRAAHAKYQLREFMVDFWNNHFNVGRDEDRFASAALPVYDREAIRPYALGNFHDMLLANAKSASMQIYLDNFVSSATTPNENYARELLELHTMGKNYYLGVAGSASALEELAAQGTGTQSPGFTDEDVIEVSKALSGWTIEFGQRVSPSYALPVTGKFIFNLQQHNTTAGKFMGVDLSVMGGISQGEKVIEIAANHKGTAEFICTKLVRRIFGDPMPSAVVARAVDAWNANATSPNQIREVMRAILLDGDEIGSMAAQKIRRPFERVVALFRTTDTQVNASAVWSYAVYGMKDGVNAWPAPNGRPDVDGFWLSTSASLTTWNLLIGLLFNPTVTTSLLGQTPASIATATEGIEYWLERMIGSEIAPESMNALVADQAGSQGAFSILGLAPTTPDATKEILLRRFVGLIATTREFSYR
ncbi:MAG: DUF1800 domain-containing protein [Rhodobacteraceae bacterium]|nr:DUF1800 domain-containing protein [Paracoccaceae bacterium]